MSKTEVRNKEDFFGGTYKNSDGSAVIEVVKDGDIVAEVQNKEGPLGGTYRNSDGTPIKEKVDK